MVHPPHPKSNFVTRCYITNSSLSFTLFNISRITFSMVLYYALYEELRMLTTRACNFTYPNNFSCPSAFLVSLSKGSQITMDTIECGLHLMVSSYPAHLEIIPHYSLENLLSLLEWGILFPMCSNILCYIFTCYSFQQLVLEQQNKGITNVFYQELL